MGKVIFEFDSVEEQEDIRNALDGYKWKLVAWDMDNILRDITRNDSSCLERNTTPSDIEYKVAEKLREEFARILTDYNLQHD